MSSESPQSIDKIWQTLPKGTKKVFQILHRLDLKYEGDVYALINNIAKWAKISRSTVYDALNRLRKLGWLGSLRRHGQSNLWFISDFLKRLKFSFSRVKTGLTSDPYNHLAVSSSFSVHKTSPAASVAPAANVLLNIKTEQQQPGAFQYPSWVPVWCRFSFMKFFDFVKFGWILRKISEQDAAIVIENMKWYQKQGHPIENHSKFFYSECYKRLQLKKVTA